MKKLLLFPVALAALLLYSCSDNDDSGKLSLHYSFIDVYEDLLYQDVRINNGSGQYEVEIEDLSVATAQIVTGEQYPYGAIRVTGKTVGRTRLTVTDKLEKKEAALEIRVNEPGISFNVKVREPDVVALRKEYIEREMSANLTGKLALETQLYQFSREDRGLVYSSTGDKKFRHVNKDGKVYLVLRESGATDDTDARWLEPVNSSKYTAYGLYMGFYGLRPDGVRSTGPAPVESLVLAFEEDFTEEYKSLYPDAGIEKAAVLYTGNFYYSIFNEKQD